MTDTNQTTSKLAAQIDGREVLSKVGCDRADIAWRKEFTGLTDADVANLAEMHPMFQDIAGDLVGEFYEHLQQYDETIAILNRSTRTVEQLVGTQTQYLIGLGQGTYDEAYFAQRARIGKIHDLLDLGPKIYLGAYSIYYEGIVEAITREAKAQFAEEGAESLDEALDFVTERVMSVLRIINLDQQVAMDTYIQSYSEQIEKELNRRRHHCADIETEIAEVTDAAENIANSSVRIGELADDQSTSSERIAGEVGTLSATVEEVASSATQVEQTSRTAEQLATDGQSAAEDAIAVMEDVDDAHHEVRTDVDDLQETVAEIDAVVDVINDIADQTNLLALNANIEAARAGEAGAGFAVVADEVKSLAEESKARATDIEGMITDIQRNTTRTVDSLDTTGERLELGVENVRTSMAKLEEIVAGVRETVQGIEEVAAATDEQAASTEEIAAMIDESSTQAEKIATEIDQVAEATGAQTQRVESVERSIKQLNDVEVDDARTR